MANLDAPEPFLIDGYPLYREGFNVQIKFLQFIVPFQPATECFHIRKKFGKIL